MPPLIRITTYVPGYTTSGKLVVEKQVHFTYISNVKNNLINSVYFLMLNIFMFKKYPKFELVIYNEKTSLLLLQKAFDYDEVVNYNTDHFNKPGFVCPGADSDHQR
jgi:hypothetical protein